MVRAIRLTTTRTQASKGTVSGVESTDLAGRAVPRWAATVVGGLARDLPPIVTRADLAGRLAEAGSDRSVEASIRELRRLGWLVRSPRAGAWSFVPPGQEEVLDPYLPIRAWLATDPNAAVILAGDAAAWHLGYLDRQGGGKVPVWLPSHTRLPDGLTPFVRPVRIGWRSDQAAHVAPSPLLLIRRRLDLVAWASRLPAFGPEALLVQLAVRPSSFEPWADLVAHLGAIVKDCDDDRLTHLLGGQSTAAWQRAAYLVHSGGHPARGIGLLERRPKASLPKTYFAPSGRSDSSSALYAPQYGIIDALIAPLQGIVGKA